MATEYFAYLKLKKTKLWDSLKFAIQQLPSIGCTYWELYLLYSHIVRNKPTKILELGAGVSTIVIAGAAAEVIANGGNCKIFSMEQNSFYFNEFDKILEKIDKKVRDVVDVILSPTEDIKISEGMISRRYLNKPQNMYDFVFIDGPSIPKEIKEQGGFDGDIIDLVDWNPYQFNVFLDNRLQTQKAILKLFPWVKHKYYKFHKFSTFIFPPKALRR